MTWSSEYDPSIDTGDNTAVASAPKFNPYHEIKQVFVITDGDVGNQDQIFDYVNKQDHKMRVFGVGIGAGASSSLVNGISERGNGFASFVSEKENTFYEVESLTQVVVKGIMAASKGFITDVQLNNKNYPGFVDTAITDGTFIHVMTAQDAIEKDVSDLQYSFKNVDNIQGQTKHVTIDHYNLARDSLLHDMGLIAIMAKKELQQTQKEYESSEYGQQVKREELEQKMIDISKAVNVLCPKTAFVGVMVDKNGVQKNSTAIDINISAENTEDMGSYGHGGPMFKSMSMPMSRIGGSVSSRGWGSSGSRGPMSRGWGSSGSRGSANRMMSMSYSSRGPPPPSMGIAFSNSAPATNTYAAPLLTTAADMATEAADAITMTPAPTTDSVVTSRHFTTTTTARTTTTTPTYGLNQLTSYLDLTNSQSVSGSWSFDDIENYIQPSKLNQLKNLSSFNQNDISTVSGIILLQEKFSSEKQDWSASADKAWDSMSFSSRIAARTLIQQVISILDLNLSVFDVVM